VSALEGPHHVAKPAQRQRRMERGTRPPRPRGRRRPDGALILLHGRGADEHDLVPVLDVLDPERRLVGLTPGAPLPGPGGGRWWYHVPRVGFPDPATFHSAYPLLTGFLDGWLAARGIGSERTVIGGFSMGCVMSYATALGPGRPSPAGMLAISGFLPTVDGWEPELDGRAACPSTSRMVPAIRSSASSSPATPAPGCGRPASTSTTTSTAAATRSILRRSER